MIRENRLLSLREAKYGGVIKRGTNDSSHLPFMHQASFVRARLQPRLLWHERSGKGRTQHLGWFLAKSTAQVSSLISSADEEPLILALCNALSCSDGIRSCRLKGKY